MPTLRNADAEHVWRQLSHKCSRLDCSARELKTRKEDPGANAERIERQLDAVEEERALCGRRLQALETGGGFRRPAADEDFRLLAAVQRVDVAPRLGWAAVLMAADELVQAYPAAVTVPAQGPPRRETFGGVQPSANGPR